MTELYFYLRGLVQREEGQTMAEYAVVLAVITIGVVVAIGTLGDNISAALDAVGAKMK
jgi:Flp pilus assembly pilin Flp